MDKIETLEQAIELAKQNCPLPTLGGQAIRILVARIEELEIEISDLRAEQRVR